MVRKFDPSKFNNFGTHQSHEYKSWLQYSFEDWVGYEFPIPLKVSSISISMKWIHQKYKFDAHPYPNFITEEIKFASQVKAAKDKPKPGQPEIDSDMIPDSLLR